MASEPATPSLLPAEIIRLKRDGGALPTEAIDTFVRGLTDGSFSDAQVAALAMAVFFRGMTMEERVDLTRAMTHSGQVLDWAGHKFGKPTVDKHSTGGVGDKVSLILAPILAACGCVVPMISGRGLGHTGGTLDKLDAIPGYVSTPSPEQFGEVLRSAGCAVIGQTGDIAPADKRFYSLRDVTATVESIPLITASILSKKLAAGLGRLVLDVKFGSGAFMTDYDKALELAQSLVAVAKGAGLPCSAILTDMNEVLGATAGNAIEVLESIEMLKGEPVDARLHEVTVALCADVVAGVGLADDDASARTMVEEALSSGAALERFSAMVAALGGPADLVDSPGKYLPLAEVELPVPALTAGVVAQMDVRGMGMSVLELGGGRRRSSDAVDFAVGLSRIRSIGDTVGPDAPICMVHARTQAAAELAVSAVQAAVTIADTAPSPTPVLRDRVQ